MSATHYIRWAVYIGDKPAPINSRPPISTFDEARLFAVDISKSIGDTNIVSVLGFSTPRSDQAPGDVLVQFRDGEEVPDNNDKVNAMPIPYTLICAVRDGDVYHSEVSRSEFPTLDEASAALNALTGDEQRAAVIRHGDEFWRVGM